MNLYNKSIKAIARGGKKLVKRQIKSSNKIYENENERKRKKTHVNMENKIKTNYL